MKSKKYHWLFFPYALIWISFTVSSLYLFINENDHMVLNLMMFPMNLVLIYLVIKSIEHKRAVSVLEKVCPQTHERMTLVGFGNVMRTKDFQVNILSVYQKEASIIVRNHKTLIFFELWTGLYLMVYSMMYFMKYLVR